MRKCRFCAEDVQDAAIVCKHCGRNLDGTTPTVKVKTSPLAWVGAALILFVIVMGFVGSCLG